MPINLTASDLHYLLAQIQIGIDYSQLSGPLDPGGVREVNGRNNNLAGGYNAQGVWVPGANINADWGQSDTDFLRLSYTDTPLRDASGNLILDANGNPTYGTSWGTTYSTLNPSLGAGGNITMDGLPRLISNLIASSALDGAAYNPAAEAAMNQNGGGYVANVNGSVQGTATGAQMPDEGILGGVPFNEFFVAFGQFFDHGLDFISKGGGYVMIPIPQNDPLYDPASPTGNMMMLSRAALSNPDTDFNPDGTMKDGVIPQFNNNTGLLIDQSQTYGSDASVNALLRQYDASGYGTGLLITGAEDGVFPGTLEEAQHDLATWSDMKANALRIGIQLIDGDVLNAPTMLVDPTGKLMFDTAPVFDASNTRVYYLASETLADMAARTGVDLATLEAHDPFMRDDTGAVLRTNQAILADIAAAADPTFHFDIDPATGLETIYLLDGVEYNYDASLLARHYVSGDGRVNENIGLTAVHHIFHEEHNIQAQATMDAILQVAGTMAAAGDLAGAAAYINNWTRSAGTDTVSVAYVDASGAAQTIDVAGVNAVGGAVSWDSDMIFQSARIITESEYNHVAIDQYVGSFAGLPEFVSYSADINVSVSLEFAQAIFRLGHSQLTEQMQIAIEDAAGHAPGTAGWDPTYASEDLFDAFLNPDAYAQYGAAGLAIGLMRQTSNDIDEFVTPALQQSLLGAPLDLAALNIARGRDVGLPTLNELREQIYNQIVQLNGSSGSGSALAPYTSWNDFGAHLGHPESLVNFIASYGRDADNVWGLEAARQAYLGGTGTIADVRAAAQAILDAFANAGDPMHADAVKFLEGNPVYDPNTHTVEAQGADMGFWDIDLWIGGLAERPLFDAPLGTTFTMIMMDFGQRMQEGDRFYYLYRMPVGQHLGDQIIGEQFADLIERTTGTEHVGDAFGSQTAFYNLTERTYNPDGSIANLGNDVWQSSTAGAGVQDGHIVVAGLSGDDYIAGGLGDDYLYGDDGDDTLNGSQGNDHLYGGAGNDFITDDENDDFIHGGDGDDYIFAGPGVLDTSHGGNGNDEVHGGDGVDEVFGDDGDDALFGEGDTDLIMGGDGDDYMDGGDSVDEMFGGNGNDWMRGGVGDDNINGGSGNDLMEGGQGPTANDGDRLNGDSPFVAGTTIIEYNGDGTQGDMDIASYEHSLIPVYASLQTSNNNGASSNLADTYSYVEGLVGSQFDDVLEGADQATSTTNGADNYLVGGGGSDTIHGLGGNDRIFGDNVIVDVELYALDDPRHDPAHGPIVDWVVEWGDLRPVFQDGTKGHVLGMGNATSDYLYGDDGNDIIYGGWAEDELHGGNGDDLLYGDSGHDQLFGDLGNNALYGGVGNDTLTAANNSVNLMVGGVGHDTYIVQRSAAVTITEEANQGIDTIIAYRNFSLGANIENLMLMGLADNATGNNLRNVLTGNDRDNRLLGRGGGDTIDGGAGNDFINGDAGNDRIIQTGATGGRDMVNGGLGNDTYQLNAVSGESYVIYTREAAVAAGMTGLAASTEIVVTLNGSGDANIIAELDNIEEIVVNSATITSPGNAGGATVDGASVAVVGDFNTTSLNFNTITVNGSSASDTVDISGLTSAHRLVFNSNGGADQVIGALRPQDVINGSGVTAGQAPLDHADSGASAWEGHDFGWKGAIVDAWDHHFL